MRKHIISILVENHSGALSRIAGLFSSRGYNISSLNVAETEEPSVSRMTLVAEGEEDILEQIIKQLNRLIDVIKVYDFYSEPVINRELILIRICSTKQNRLELVSLINIYSGKIVSVSPSSVTVEITGTTSVLDDFISMVKPYGIKEMVRSGKLAIARTKK
jgi:acetolactate synthase-1/3 small subunit